MNNKTTRNSILLLVTAAVWGAAFGAQYSWWTDNRSILRLIVSGVLSGHWY